MEVVWEFKANITYILLLSPFIVAIPELAEVCKNIKNFVHAKTFQETIPIPAATELRDFAIVDEVERCDSVRKGNW